jgi:hypothetical protein
MHLYMLGTQTISNNQPKKILIVSLSLTALSYETFFKLFLCLWQLCHLKPLVYSTTFCFYTKLLEDILFFIFAKEIKIDSCFTKLLEMLEDYILDVEKVKKNHCNLEGYLYVEIVFSNINLLWKKFKKFIYVWTEGVHYYVCLRPN